MSLAKWMVAMILGVLPVFGQAQVLDVFSETSGHVTASDGPHWQFGDVDPGEPVTVNFDVRHWPTDATVEAGTLTLQSLEFFSFGVTVGGQHLDIPPPSSWSSLQPQSTFALQDNVRNAAGDQVDVVDLVVPIGIPYSWGMHHRLTTHLEFAGDTFDGLDAWSILSLSDAPLLAGTLHLFLFEDRLDFPLPPANIYADLTGFTVRFAGPFTEVPAVPEPAPAGMLLAGLAGAVLMRRRAAGTR